MLSNKLRKEEEEEVGIGSRRFKKTKLQTKLPKIRIQSARMTKVKKISRIRR